MAINVEDGGAEIENQAISVGLGLVSARRRRLREAVTGAGEIKVARCVTGQAVDCIIIVAAQEGGIFQSVARRRDANQKPVSETAAKDWLQSVGRYWEVRRKRGPRHPRGAIRVNSNGMAKFTAASTKIGRILERPAIRADLRDESIARHSVIDVAGQHGAIRARNFLKRF